MIETTFTVTEEEYIDLQKAHWRVSRWKRVRQRIWLGLLSCVSIYSTFELAQHTKADRDFLYLFLAIYPSLLILIGLVRAPFTSNSQLRKKFRIAAPQLSDIHTRIDEVGYQHNVPEKTEGVFYWPAFSSWMESSQVIVLFRSDVMYPIPKSALSPDQQNELRALLQTSINASSPRAQMFSGLSN